MERIYKSLAILTALLAFLIPASFAIRQPRGYIHFGFGDETYYYLAAKTWATRGIGFPYIPQVNSVGEASDFGDPIHKSPLVYLIPTIFYVLGNGDLSIYSLFPSLFFSLTVGSIYFLGKELIGREAALLAAILTLGIPFFSHFSVLSYVNTLISFTFITSVLLFALCMEGKVKWYWPALSLGIAFLTLVKLTLPLFPAFLLYGILRKKVRTTLKIVLLALAMWIPWGIRNTLIFGGPFYPYFPELFNYKHLDRRMQELRMKEVAFVPIEDLVNVPRLFSAFSLPLLFSILGLSLCLLNPSNSLWLLVTIFGSLPFSIVGAKDLRYVMHLIPILAFPACKELVKNLEKLPKSKYLRLGTLATLLLISSSICFGESKRVYEVNRHFNPPGFYEGAYYWIAMNTPNEDYAIMDLFFRDAQWLLQHFQPNNKRITFFMNPLGGSDLWEFWRLEKEEMLARLKKYKIKYIVVETYFYETPPWRRKFLGWTHIPQEAIIRFNSLPENFKLVFDNKQVWIFEVRYNEV